MLDWKDLDIYGGDNDISVTHVMGYCLRVVKRGDGHGYNSSAISVYGEELIGFSRDRDKCQAQAETWVYHKARSYVGGK